MVLVYACGRGGGGLTTDDDKPTRLDVAREKAVTS